MVVPKAPPPPRQQEKRPSTVQIWLTAARPHTLTASLCPCLVAYAANSHLLLLSNNNLLLALVWLVFCVTVQLGTNLHNDYADYVRGADTGARLGHARATARGWLTARQTCAAATLCLSATLAAGVFLVHATQQWRNPVLWFLVLSSVFNAFAYTSGPYPLGYVGLQDWSIAYSGLGDVFVFLYFGLVATLMLPYLLHLQQTQTYQAAAADDGEKIDWFQQWMYATQVGLLATNIIVGTCSTWRDG